MDYSPYRATVSDWPPGSMAIRSSIYCESSSRSLIFESGTPRPARNSRAAFGYGSTTSICCTELPPVQPADGVFEHVGGCQVLQGHRVPDDGGSLRRHGLCRVPPHMSREGVPVEGRLRGNRGKMKGSRPEGGRSRSRCSGRVSSPQGPDAFR
jgi:hypothetical protein